MSDHVTTQRRVIYSLMALLPLLLVIVAVELHLRAETRQWYEKKLAKNRALKSSLLIHRRSEDPILIYELTPGAAVSKQGIYYQINQAGFRDDEFPVPERRAKLASEYRIVVLGDSVAWGWGVEMAQAWPQQLERQLSLTMADKQVRVYNLAVNGYSTPQEVRVMEKIGFAYQPDMVILNYVLNDPEVEDGGLSWYFQASNRIEIVFKGKLLCSMLFNIIKAEMGWAPKAANNSATDHFYLTHQSDLFENVRRGFDDLAEMTGKHHVPVIVMVTPVFQFTKQQAYPWRQLHQQIETLSLKHRFIFLDTQPLLAEFNSSDVSFDPIHPNIEGHRQIAAAIKEKLMAKP